MKMKTVETNKIENIEQALAALGVTAKTLNDQEKKLLDEQGYLVIEDALSPKELKQAQTAFEELAEQARKTGNATTEQESGTRHVGALVNKSPAFDCIIAHPKLLAAVYYILKAEFRTSGLHGRDPLPGFGQQALHADWGQRPLAEPFQVVTTLTMLDNFTVENGATRVVPGSHLFYEAAYKKFRQPNASHPDQIQVVAPAGTILVFNGHLWHSGMQNNSKRSRRAVLGSFGLNRNVFQATTEFEERPDLALAVRYLLGS